MPGSPLSTQTDICIFIYKIKLFFHFIKKNINLKNYKSVSQISCPIQPRFLISIKNMLKHIIFFSWSTGRSKVNKVWLCFFALKWKCFDNIFITSCPGRCQFYNFQCSQWWKFHQNNISISVYESVCYIFFSNSIFFFFACRVRVHM